MYNMQSLQTDRKNMKCEDGMAPSAWADRDGENARPVLSPGFSSLLLLGIYSVSSPCLGRVKVRAASARGIAIGEE